jgi:putative lipoprotein
LGGQTVLSAGNQFPFPFEVTYNPADIDPRLTYALRVRITDAQGQLLYINTQSYKVITNSNPEFGVEVIVDPIQ